MRIEELLGLEKRDFDLNNNTLSIRRTYQRIGGVDYLEEITKTPSSRRKNYMGSILEKVVKEFFDYHPNLKDDERMFPTSQRTVYKWMKKGCERQGVPFTHPHSLRNSLITNGISKGINPKSISVYVGHSSPRTTLDVYTKCHRKDEVEIGNLYQEPQTHPIELFGTKCMVCGFDFEKTYGEWGKDFIEVHHIKPLSGLDEEVEINPETDLICLCSNCHSMIHRKKNQVLSIEELRKMIKK